MAWFCRWSRKSRALICNCAVSTPSWRSRTGRSPRTARRVELFELQYKYGQVPKLNVEQARSSYETAAAQIPQIESQIAQTEDALSVLLGRNPGAIPRGKSIEALASPPVPAGLPSQLLERRPDIAQAEQNLIAANAQIGAAKALVLSDDLADRRFWQPEHRSAANCSRGRRRCGVLRDR